MKNVKELSLVFVETLYLYIVDAVWIKEVILLMLEIISKSLFVILFNCDKFIESFFIIDKLFKIFEV